MLDEATQRVLALVLFFLALSSVLAAILYRPVGPTNTAAATVAANNAEAVANQATTGAPRSALRAPAIIAISVVVMVVVGVGGGLALRAYKLKNRLPDIVADVEKAANRAKKRRPVSQSPWEEGLPREESRKRQRQYDGTEPR